MTGTQIEKEEAKLPIFIYYMILHIKNQLKTFRTNSSRLQDTRSIYKNQLCFSTLAMPNQKMKLRKQFHLKQDTKELNNYKLIDK